MKDFDWSNRSYFEIRMCSFEKNKIEAEAISLYRNHLPSTEYQENFDPISLINEIEIS